MPLDAKKYQRLKELLDSGGNMSDDVRTMALEAVDEYENTYLTKAAPAGNWVEEMPEDAIGPLQPQAPLPTQESLTQDLMRRLDPSHPIQPQVLAITPATGHPGGDKAAEDEWVRGELNNPNGMVVVYDMPVDVARRKVMDNPQLLKSIGFNVPLTPDAIEQIQQGDSIHQALNDREWMDVADAAVKAGKTPYRYSKAPWMQGGANAGVLDTLSTKVKHSALPGLEAGTAFVMGHDSIANFGAINAAGNAGLMDEQAQSMPARQPTVPGAVPIGGGNDEVVGGVSASLANEGEEGSEGPDMLRSEHPDAFAAGQAAAVVPAVGRAAVGAVGAGLGAAESATVKYAQRGLKALEEWNPVNHLWEAVMSTGAPKWVPGAVAGVGKAAAASAASQAVTEGVEAGANLVGTGETGKTLAGTAGRIGKAAEEGATIAGAVEGVAGGAKTLANWTRNPAARYRGLPGELERAGVEPQFMRGYVPPAEVKAATAEAEQIGAGVQAHEVLASRVAPQIRDGARAIENEARVAAQREQAAARPKPAKPPEPVTFGGKDAHPGRKRPEPKKPAVRATGPGRKAAEANRSVERAKRTADTAAPRGDATDTVVAFAKDSPAGRKRRVHALREAADRAGPEARRQLEQTRVPVLLERLDKLNAITRKRNGDGAGILPAAARTLDQVYMRGIYPVIRGLERGFGGPLGEVAKQVARGDTQLETKKQTDDVEFAKRQTARDAPHKADYATATEAERKQADKPRRLKRVKRKLVRKKRKSK